MFLYYEHTAYLSEWTILKLSINNNSTDLIVTRGDRSGREG